jgi:hypothetical protein
VCEYRRPHALWLLIGSRHGTIRFILRRKSSEPTLLSEIR